MAGADALHPLPCVHPGFSAVPIFTTMMISTFNMIFTACPIVAYAVLGAGHAHADCAGQP